MALPVRGEVPSLAEEMMDAVSAEIGLGQEQVGVGLGVGALVGKSPKGRWQHQLQQREAIPGSPHTPLNVADSQESDEEGQGAAAEDVTPARTDVRRAGTIHLSAWLKAPTTPPRNSAIVLETPSTTESHRLFSDDSEPVLRTEFLKLRGQLKDTRTALRDMTALYQEDVYELRTQLRYIFMLSPPRKKEERRRMWR